MQAETDDITSCCIKLHLKPLLLPVLEHHRNGDSFLALKSTDNGAAANRLSTQERPLGERGPLASVCGCARVSELVNVQVCVALL